MKQENPTIAITEMNKMEQGKMPKPLLENHNNDNEKEKDQQITSITRGDEFESPHALVRIAILQICKSIGFKSLQHSALSTLADIASRYLCHLGKSAHFYANLAGRTDSTALNVIHALEDMNQQQGFAGASDVINRRISASQTVRDVANYVRRGKEVPFAWPVSRFPAVVKRRLEVAPPPSSAGKREAPPQGHIPPWLPAFPSPSSDLNPNAAHFSARVSLFEAFAPSKQERDRDPAEEVVIRGVRRKSEILAAERPPVQFKIESGKNAASIYPRKRRAAKIGKAAMDNIQN